MESDAAYAMGTSLLDAVTTALSAAGFDEPCRLGMVPGGAIADDACCEDGCSDQLAGGFTSMFLATEPWPSAINTVRANCPEATLAVDLLVRYSFCVPGLTDKTANHLPLVADLDAAASTAMQASQAMLCAGAEWCSAWVERALCRGVTPVGPSGACLGLDLRVVAEMADVP